MREIQHVYIRGAVNLRPDRQFNLAPETASNVSPVKSSG
jgi:hypothetical protein